MSDRGRGFDEWVKSDFYKWFRDQSVQQQQEILSLYTEEENEKLEEILGEQYDEFIKFIQSLNSFTQEQDLSRATFVDLMEEYEIDRAVAHLVYDRTEGDTVRQDLQFIRVNVEKDELEELSKASVDNLVGTKLISEDAQYRKGDSQTDAAIRLIWNFILPTLSNRYKARNVIQEIFVEEGFSEEEVTRFLNPVFENINELRWTYSLFKLNNLQEEIEELSALCGEIKSKLGESSTGLDQYQQKGKDEG